jgi:hypothetical protein
MGVRCLGNLIDIDMTSSGSASEEFWLTPLKLATPDAKKFFKKS